MSTQTTYHVGGPNIGDRTAFFERVNSLLDRRWLTNNGDFVQELERKLSDYLGVKHFICVNNGTRALEISIKGLNLSGEVILPAFTFVASAHALSWLGIKPVFCDIDPESYCIDPNQVEQLITPQTTGIMGVHLYGHPCNHEALQGIADKHNLNLFYDAAHAFGCTLNGTMIGNFGRCEAFSFHATKYFNTVEGGGIATNDTELANRFKALRDYGYDPSDKITGLGTNGKMDEISAAMGLTNFESLEHYRDVNLRNYNLYDSLLEHIPALSLISFPENEQCNRQYIIVEMHPDIRQPMEMIIEKLKARRILARRYFWPGCHRIEPYVTLEPAAAEKLPVTEDIAARIIALPTGTTVNEHAIHYIVDSLENLL